MHEFWASEMQRAPKLPEMNVTCGPKSCSQALSAFRLCRPEGLMQTEKVLLDPGD